MSLSAPMQPLARPFAPTERGLFVIALLTAAGLAWALQWEHARLVLATGAFRDSDDAMRMVQVRDLLAGQGWFDLTQHRLLGSAPMHWSRLIDAPIALLVRGFEIIADPVLAERLARLVWSGAIQLAFFAAIVALARDLGGRNALLPAGLLAGLGLLAAAQFTPGRIDHHGVQITLTLVLVRLVLVAERPRSAALAGMLAALSLAIGFETLPFVAALAVILGLRWVFSEAEAGRRLVAFMAAMAFGMLVAMAVTVVPARWTETVCDALGAPLVAAALLGAAASGLFVTSETRFRTWPVRLAAAALVGGVVVGALALTFPACRAGPYGAIPPDLAANWLAHVAEARSVPAQAALDPGVLLAVLGAGLAGLVALVMALTFDTRRRTAWAGLLALALVALALTFDQIRAAAYLTVLALPPLAWGAGILWLRSKPLAVVVILAGSGPVWGIAALATMRGSESNADSCFAPEAFRDLAALPPGLVLAPIDLGAHVLATTPHRAVAAPYHRNIEGLRDGLAISDGAPYAVRALARQTGASYLVLCPALVTPAASASALATQLIQGEAPPWLVPAAPAGILRVWRIVAP